MASLLLLVFLLALLISPSQADTAICTSQTFKNKLYANCTDLPSLSSYLHWAYNASNSSLAVAFVFVAYAKFDSWIAWAINPTGTKMIGAQALIAYIHEDGTPVLKTYNITSYSSIVPGKLSFDVWDMSTEYTDFNSAFTIFATVKVPEKAETVNQVWQVGPGFSKTTGMIEKHDFATENLVSYGPLSLVANIRDSTSPVSSPPSPGSSPPSPGSSSLSRDWIIGISVGISMTILVIVSIIYISRKRILVFFKKDEKDELDVEAFIRNYGLLTPKRYRYSKLQKMTNSFKDQIGKGGFGTVYKGKLTDDNDLLVAVKVLRELEGSGEDFINEVASIGRSSHVNIVTLVGFCYERAKRALIYEYMPNGSLDKFIRKQGSSSADCSFDYWKTLSKIAVGIARGLEYLHRGCNTRILHFDIKPQNILLDNDLCPKISDFGLAKLCKTKESIITHPGIRGTAGYMAPEVYSRNFGGVSHKSDVYSYGMLVLEMVGARRNLYSQVSESHTSEEFPHYIYKDLELLDSDENIYGATSEEEKEIARKMIIVSLGCIQTIPSDRPSMHKVLEMLEGPLQSLSVPPKPLFISTARYVAEASVTTSEPSESGQGNQF
ncbi:hypothetical protein M0R45_020762 [Rubus argutus]|uniref:Protein kinase domain-containing protein n=1 Tax=Rubus argutus TaxID=59490 RepID=A0AAW1XBK5_RUBAR